MAERLGDVTVWVMEKLVVRRVLSHGTSSTLSLHPFFFVFLGVTTFSRPIHSSACSSAWISAFLGKFSSSS